MSWVEVETGKMNHQALVALQMGDELAVPGKRCHPLEALLTDGKSWIIPDKGERINEGTNENL